MEHNVDNSSEEDVDVGKDLYFTDYSVGSYWRFLYGWENMSGAVLYEDASENSIQCSLETEVRKMI